MAIRKAQTQTTHAINIHPKDEKALGALRTGKQPTKNRNHRPPSRGIAGRVIALGLEVYELQRKGMSRKKALSKAAALYSLKDDSASRAYTIFCRSIGEEPRPGRPKKKV